MSAVPAIVTAPPRAEMKRGAWSAVAGGWLPFDASPQPQLLGPRENMGEA
jgi:hypothetical protein